MTKTKKENDKHAEPRRTMVFVDDANFSMTVKEFGVMADYVALRKFLSHRKFGCKIIEMVVYMGFPPQMKEEYLPKEWKLARDRMMKKRDFLEFHDFLTVPWYGKESQRNPRTNERIFSANVDIIMAMDAMEFSFDVKPDLVVLVTGDQDFSHLALKLRRRGIRVEAASIERKISRELKKSVNAFIDLTQFINILKKKSNVRR